MKAKLSQGGCMLIALVLAWLAFAWPCLAADRYWVGMTGDYWDNAADWSLTDGGPGGAGQPWPGITST